MFFQACQGREFVPSVSCGARLEALPLDLPSVITMGSLGVMPLGYQVGAALCQALAVTGPAWIGSLSSPSIKGWPGSRMTGCAAFCQVLGPFPMWTPICGSRLFMYLHPDFIILPSKVKRIPWQMSCSQGLWTGETWLEGGRKRGRQSRACFVLSLRRACSVQMLPMKRPPCEPPGLIPPPEGGRLQWVCWWGGRSVGG